MITYKCIYVKLRIFNLLWIREDSTRPHVALSQECSEFPSYNLSKLGS